MKIRYILPLICFLTAAPTLSQVITTYSYDSLGRLVRSSDAQTGGTDIATVITYDAANNRNNYRVGDAGQAPTAPVAKNPTFSLSSGQSTSFSLASLATTSAPALIASFTPSSGGGSATIASGGQSVSYTAPSVPTSRPCEPAITRTYSIPYTVRNQDGGTVVPGSATISARGAAGQLRPGMECP